MKFGIFLICFAFVYSLYIVPNFSFLDSFHSRCIQTINIDLSFLRGKNYYLNDETSTEKNKNCLTTMWNGIHVLFYFILGLLFPEHIKILSFLGIAFEVFEFFVFDCHDISDIIYNELGLLLSLGFK